MSDQGWIIKHRPGLCSIGLDCFDAVRCTCVLLSFISGLSHFPVTILYVPTTLSLPFNYSTSMVNNTELAIAGALIKTPCGTLVEHLSRQMESHQLTIPRKSEGSLVCPLNKH